MHFKDSIVKITVGEEYDQHALIHQLKEIGYRKVTQVQTQGEFSLRGDILDIFEISQLEPYRIEFLVMKSMVLGHLKSKHNYRKKIRQNSLSFQLVIFF